MQLNVPFSEIPEQGVECEIKDSSWFPVDRVGQDGPVSVHLRLTRKSDNRVELKGVLQVKVTLDCDRCLEHFPFQVDSPMQLVLEVPEYGEHWRLHDMELAEVELETITLDQPVVDLAEILRQQLLLAVPEKKLCTKKCSGLCPHCGTNLNKGNCSCARQDTSSPFAVLETLKKKQ